MIKTHTRTPNRLIFFFLLLVLLGDVFLFLVLNRSNYLVDSLSLSLSMRVIRSRWSAPEKKRNSK